MNYQSVQIPYFNITMLLAGLTWKPRKPRNILLKHTILSRYTHTKKIINNLNRTNSATLLLIVLVYLSVCISVCLSPLSVCHLCLSVCLFYLFDFYPLSFGLVIVNIFLFFTQWITIFLSSTFLHHLVFFLKGRKLQFCE